MDSDDMESAIILYIYNYIASNYFYIEDFNNNSLLLEISKSVFRTTPYIDYTSENSNYLIDDLIIELIKNMNDNKSKDYILVRNYLTLYLMKKQKSNNYFNNINKSVSILLSYFSKDDILSGKCDKEILSVLKGDNKDFKVTKIKDNKKIKIPKINDEVKKYLTSFYSEYMDIIKVDLTKFVGLAYYDLLKKNVKLTEVLSGDYDLYLYNYYKVDNTIIFSEKLKNVINYIKTLTNNSDNVVFVCSLLLLKEFDYSYIVSKALDSYIKKKVLYEKIRENSVISNIELKDLNEINNDNLLNTVNNIIKNVTYPLDIYLSNDLVSLVHKVYITYPQYIARNKDYGQVCLFKLFNEIGNDYDLMEILFNTFKHNKNCEMYDELKAYPNYIKYIYDKLFNSSYGSMGNDIFKGSVNRYSKLNSINELKDKDKKVIKNMMSLYERYSLELEREFINNLGRNR